jgi:hypothetical protein
VPAGQAGQADRRPGPRRAPYDYYNFAETPSGADAVLAPASYHRLQKIKATYDPDQAIISAHPVWPEEAPGPRKDMT